MADNVDEIFPRELLANAPDSVRGEIEEVLDDIEAANEKVKSLTRKKRSCCSCISDCFCGSPLSHLVKQSGNLEAKTSSLLDKMQDDEINDDLRNKMDALHRDVAKAHENLKEALGYSNNRSSIFCDPCEPTCWIVWLYGIGAFILLLVALGLLFMFGKLLYKVYLW